MSARERIADRLWWSVPSSDDADAKAKASTMLDAFRAEVLNEAANGLATLGLVDSLVSGPQAWTEAIETLRRMAAPESQPETAPDAPAVGDRYDCRHGGEGVTVTRLWALDNGHRAVDFEYHDGESSALPLDSFRRAYRPEAAPDGDEWVRCSGLHCPNAERFARAAERGWQPGGLGTWQCPTCATGAES